MTTAAGWTSLFNFVKSFSYGFLVGLPVYVTFADHGYCVARVDGISMQPHLNPLPRKKDIVLLSRWAAKSFDTIQRGEIVSLISPSDPDTKLIKRVIGLEGDIIKTLGYNAKTVRIPRGHCWIEGDNHAHSLDSNSFGPISLGLINGRASHILWPPSRFQKLKAFVPDDRRPADKLIPPSEGDILDNAPEHMSATSLCYEEESFGSCECFVTK